MIFFNSFKFKHCTFFSTLGQLNIELLGFVYIMYFESLYLYHNFIFKRHLNELNELCIIEIKMSFDFKKIFSILN